MNNSEWVLFPLIALATLKKIVVIAVAPCERGSKFNCSSNVHNKKSGFSVLTSRVEKKSVLRQMILNGFYFLHTVEDSKISEMF